MSLHSQCTWSQPRWARRDLAQAYALIFFRSEICIRIIRRMRFHIKLTKLMHSISGGCGCSPGAEAIWHLSTLDMHVPLQHTRQYTIRMNNFVLTSSDVVTCYMLHLMRVWKCVTSFILPSTWIFIVEYILVVLSTNNRAIVCVIRIPRECDNVISLGPSALFLHKYTNK